MPAGYSLPLWPTLYRERGLEGRVCGIDEAGCAPLAGPVVAAAVVLPTSTKPRALRGLTDSKLLSAEKREHFFGIIHEIAQVGVGMASVDEIDTINIHHADLLAMTRAFEALPAPPDHALVDGRAKPPLNCDVEAIVKGDRRSLSIAAASVVAKVTRDRIMHALAERFPDYGWQTNVGYGTDVHYLGLLRRGPTQHHRRSFAPLNTIFGPGGPSLERYSFGRIDTAMTLEGLELFFLRNDLHAVFDGRGRHVGAVKNLRGHWTFQAVGYSHDGNPQPGAGPCSRFHGSRIDSPQPELVSLLLSAL